MNNLLDLDSTVAWSLDIDELYELLDSEIEDVPQGQLTTQVELMNKSFGDFAKKVAKQAKFERSWAKIKGIVCKAYADGVKAEGKDLVTILTTAVISALGLGSGIWVVITVTIAVKQGLDKLCSV